MKFKDIKWSEHYDVEADIDEDAVRVRIPIDIQAAIMVSIALGDLADAVRDYGGGLRLREQKKGAEVTNWHMRA